MQKIKVTALQRANALEARDVMWPSVPTGNVARGLAFYSERGSAETDCGTVACFGGWCARWPGFVAQGVRLDARGVPETLSGRWGLGVADELFGESGLFFGRNGISVDAGFRGSDHALVTRRLNWLIANSEVIA